MFRPTDSQKSLLECQFLMPPSKRARLEKSWAESFRKCVLPLIDEESFRNAFSQDNGRPNKSIRLLTGLHLLKDWNDLTDEQVIDQLEYNLQWQYALGVTADDAHTCQKTMHNFRVLLLSDERAKEMLARITRGLAESDGIDLGKQRLDSTHIISNIAVLTRLGLFTETVMNFLRELQRHHEEHLKQVSAEHVKRYLDREGYFADAKREEARRRLPIVARDVLTLVRQFEGDKEIASLVSFGLLQRLLMEQCEIVDDGDQDGGFENDTDQSMGPKVEVQAPTTASSSSPPPTPPVEEPREDGHEASPKVQPEQSSSTSVLSADEEPSEDDEIEPKELLKNPSSISSSSLQSPHDPDATYGHKGKGYEAQVAESYDEGNPYQLITGVSINGANESDHHALIPMLEQLDESGMSPKVMMADTGYGSGANIVESARRGVDLIAPVQDPNKSTCRAETRETTEDVAAQGEAGQGPQPVGVVDTEGALAVLNIRGFDCEAFEFDALWDTVISCPGGAVPVRQNTNGDKFTAVFSAFGCAICALSDLCPTRILASGERILQRAPSTAATKHRQHEQQTPAFKEHYKKRSGIESTNNELKGRHGADNLRVRGRSRVELAMLLKALAVNTKRAVQYHTRRLIDATQDSVLQPA